jgi:amidase
VLEAAVAALGASGVMVRHDARPALDLREAVRTYQTLLLPIVLAGLPPEQFQALVDAAAALPPGADDAFARTARLATIRHRDWLVANEQRERVRAEFAGFFNTHDVLLLPVVPVAAIPHDHDTPLPARTIEVNGARRSYHDLFSWIGLASMAHLPATVAPVGRTRRGLPVGLQIVGPQYEDRTTIDFATRLAEVVGGFTPPPDC